MQLTYSHKSFLRGGGSDVSKLIATYKGLWEFQTSRIWKFSVSGQRVGCANGYAIIYNFQILNVVQPNPKIYAELFFLGENYK